jgi:hypothetical protein
MILMFLVMSVFSCSLISQNYSEIAERSGCIHDNIEGQLRQYLGHWSLVIGNCAWSSPSGLACRNEMKAGLGAARVIGQ